MAKVKKKSIGEILSEKKEEFSLKLVAGKAGMDGTVSSPDIHRPGLALAGYVKFFRRDRIQVLGRTEMSYLENLDPRKREKTLDRTLTAKVPCLIVTNSQKVPGYLSKLCGSRKVPIIVTSMDTGTLIRELTEYLSSTLAPEKIVHGTLVDVYGMGLLLTGSPGIGKSEAALALVERGHRLVADDVVKILKRSESLLIGTGLSRPEAGLSHHMEIKGLGVIDIYSIFGITAIRLQKRVEVQVELIRWSRETAEVKLEMEEETVDMMGVDIPLVRIPLVAGKNVAILCEVVAMNHLLKVWGYEPALAFDEKLIKLMGGHEELDTE